MRRSDAQNNVQVKPIAGQRRAVARLHARLHEVMLGGWPASRGLFSNFATWVIPIFAMTLALLIMAQSRPWSGRYLFLAFDGFQCEGYHRRGNTLNSLRAVTFRTSLVGRSVRIAEREPIGLKRSVRVQAFTCSWSLTR